MKSETMTDDLAFVRQLAEEGATTPALSGRFSVWWGVLLALTLVVHWSAMSGFGPVSGGDIGFVWLGMAIVGVIGAAILGRNLGEKPGAFGPVNRVAARIWPVIGCGIFAYVGAIVLAVAVRGQSPVLFDTIMPAAFLLYGTASMAENVLARSGSAIVPVLCVAFAAILMVLVAMPVQYLVAALGVVLTQVVPGMLAIRDEPSEIV